MADEPIKFHVTITFTYEAERDFYSDGLTLQECADLDAPGIMESPEDFTRDAEDLKVVVTPVKEED